MIDAIRLYFAYQGNQSDDGADHYYSNINSMLSVTKMSVYLVETAVSDLFLVSLSNSFLLTRVMLIQSRHQLYRCYVVWGANIAVLAPPIILYVAEIGKTY